MTSRPLVLKISTLVSSSINYLAMQALKPVGESYNYPHHYENGGQVNSRMNEWEHPIKAYKDEKVLDPNKYLTRKNPN